MKHLRELWDLGADVFDSFKPHYQTAMIAVIKATGANNAWRTLYITRGCEPQPLTHDIFRHMFPYDLFEDKQQHIDDLIKKEFLQQVEPESYILTKAGTKAINRIFTIAHREIGKIQAAPFHDMKRVANLLEYVVAAALHAPEPVNKCSLALSRWTDIGSTGPSSTRIDQYMTDLKRFYADCHIASWQHYGVEGYVWETFTTLWKEDANSAETVKKVLKNRAYTVEDYACAIDKLISRGWVEPGIDPGMFQPSPKGMAVRGEAERVTDQLFFAPWQAALSPDEMSELHVLMTQIVVCMEGQAA